MDAMARIAAAVTPAVMVSACGLVALGLDNQVARMSSRVRELAREHREAGLPPARRALVEAQVRVLDRRHGLYSRALLLVYGALFAFVVTSLLWLGDAFVDIPPAFPVILFGVGVLMLAAMAVLVVAAIGLARETVRAEAGEVLPGPGAAPGGEPARAHV
jgi:uncharacterized protein DUF2721